MSQSWYNCSFLAGGLLSQHTCSFQSHADIKHVKRRLELQPLPDDRSHKMIIEALKRPLLHPPWTHLLTVTEAVLID